MATFLQPHGAGAALVSVTLILGILSTITVALRVIVRLRAKALGMDDYLMILGCLWFIACCTVTTIAAYSGLGTLDKDIAAADPSGRMPMNAYKFFLMYQITYVWSLPFIKASICVALLRITKTKRYAYPLWFIIILSSSTSFAGFVGALCNCKPVAASWDPSLGSCDTTGRILLLSRVISVAAIVTDWACAIIPAFIIWNLQMKMKQKLTLCGILALGVVASISTIIRFPYLNSYSVPEDQLYNFGIMNIWTMLECGLGIIAGSLPSLRPLLRKFGFTSEGGKSSYGYNSKRSRGTGIGTGTGEGGTSGSRAIPLSQMRGHTTNIQSKGGDGGWEQIDDNSSQRFIIMKNTQVDVKWSEDAP